MEKILQAFSDIADVLPRVDRLKATFPRDANFNQVVGLIYSDILEFHQRAYKMFRRKAWHFWFAFDWGLFERRFKLILQKLERHCDLLDKEAAAAHYSEMKQLRDKCQLEEDSFEQQRQTNMARDVFRWLSAAEDQQEDHLHQISDRRQPETCNWVLKDPQMRSWIEDDSGDTVLWMTGIPGGGKSYVCSLLVENLQTQQHISSLYYFCGHKSPSEDTCAIILRTLAVQLLQQNSDMASLVHQAYLQKGSNRSSVAMKRLLTQVVPDSKVARIIVDGIDEIDRSSQEEVLKALIELQKSTDHCCKLLVSSRDEPQIQKSLAARTQLRLGEKTVEGLSLYIKDRTKILQQHFPGMNPALVKIAEQRLHSKAKGMFLWVRLVTQMLIHQTSELEIEDAIDRLPEGLDEAYGVIKARIDSLRPIQLRQRAFDILYWVCAARRPITLHEVADGIVLHPGQTVLNRRTRSINPDRDIIDICAPLMEKLENGVIDLVHFSAKEYFVHEQSGFFIDVAKAHLNIALSCVINLTSCLDLVPRYTEGISENDIESRVVQGYYGLQSYGQEFWAEHVLAYLGQVGNRDADFRRLIDVLEAFSQVWKHRAHTETSLSSTKITAEASLGLNSLLDFPKLHRFILGWLHFKSELSKTRPTFNTLDAQEQWRLKADETYLSLIDSRLCIVIEGLVKMQSSQLPSHIDEDDFKDFISRFKLPCRFQGCNLQYSTVQERYSHELSHSLSFPCLQCDFSGRGFRSRKDLEKHTQKYHMSPEDYEIPDDLHTIGGCSGEGPNLGSGTFRVPSNRSGRWNERGRRALQQGLAHVLARLESEIESSVDYAGEPSSVDVTSRKAVGPGMNQHIIETTTMMNLDSIRHNVKEQKYEGLADFKNDLIRLSGDSVTVSKLIEDGRIRSICDDELEKAVSAFPDFANFDKTASEKGINAISTSMSTEQLQGNVEAFDAEQNEVAPPNDIPFRTRVPYWSVPEEEQFPELLQRYGRDFSKIADLLKTKTPEQVDQHFVHLLSMGNIELLNSADLADARLQRELCGIGPTMEAKDATSEMQSPDDLARENLSDLLQPNQPSSAGLCFSQFGSIKTPQSLFRGTNSPAEMNTESGEPIQRPMRKKRRPRPRVLCPHCSSQKDGYRDEYALEKHIERFHTATRKVWICEDNSIDKRFLTKCRLCSSRKGYSSKHHARNHLRKEHFNAETSAETFPRWMRETEQPNPRMQTPSASSASATRPRTKRQKTQGSAISIPPLKYYSDSSRTLPSMTFGTSVGTLSNLVPSPRSSSSLDTDLDEDDDSDARDASHPPPEDESFKNDVFLEDISFDNFLPGNNIESRRSQHDDGPPHHVNRALIKPDQVPRLPHLDHFREVVCLDQVKALYHILDNANEHGQRYQQALESLTSLSRFLMRDLRDWQRRSTLAPDIPFSV